MSRKTDKTMNDLKEIPGSFRDPSGSVRMKDGRVYRQVNQQYRAHYEQLMCCGLYSELTQDRLLIPHAEIDEPEAPSPGVYKHLLPEQIPFISYPYEWCFGQLKDAALLTLEIQRRAVDAGMSLKDCSAYNVQFLDGQPIFIDTLSFERYQEGQPWVAYRQFCQHFLAPLALMAHVDIRLQQLLRVHLDGIPLDLASQLLPNRTRLNIGLLMHIHLHAKAQARYSGRRPSIRRQRDMSKTSFLGLVESLRSTVQSLSWQPLRTGWQAYYPMSIYNARAMAHKQRVVAEMLDSLDHGPYTVWDLGANTGLFSRIASAKGCHVISVDRDPGAVEENYRIVTSQGERGILPLVMDLANPSPDHGWAGRERMSLLSRGPADTVVALALVHHLAIAQNVPFSRIAGFLDQCCESLIIEFIPKTDRQVQKLLRSREDIFGGYDARGFELEFSRLFSTQRRETISETDRILYLMEKRKPVLIAQGRRGATG